MLGAGDTVAAPHVARSALDVLVTTHASAVLPAALLSAYCPRAARRTHVLEEIQRAHGTCDWRVGARGVWGHGVVTFFLPPAVTLLHALESNANLAGFAETKPLRLPRVALHRARGLLAPCAQLIVLHLHDHKRLVRCPRLLRNPGPAPTTSCAHNATTSCVDARTTAHDRANLPWCQ